MEELPIACVGQNYKMRCNANHLTATGKRVLRDAKLSSDVLGYIDASIKHERLEEREATAYLFRRNFATHLHILGLDEAEIQYVIGHEIEENTERRSFFVNPEKLYLIKLKMDNRPLMSERHPFSTSIILSPQNPSVLLNIASIQTVKIIPDTQKPMVAHISVQATEPHENIDIEIKHISSPVLGTLLSTSAKHEGGKVNIINQYHDVYRRKASSTGTR